MVREMGLEPIRRGHTHLKRACLPIPALAHIYSLLRTRNIISRKTEMSTLFYYFFDFNWRLILKAEMNPEC